MASAMFLDRRLKHFGLRPKQISPADSDPTPWSKQHPFHLPHPPPHHKLNPTRHSLLPHPASTPTNTIAIHPISPISSSATRIASPYPHPPTTPSPQPHFRPQFPSRQTVLSPAQASPSPISRLPAFRRRLPHVPLPSRPYVLCLVSRVPHKPQTTLPFLPRYQSLHRRSASPTRRLRAAVFSCRPSLCKSAQTASLHYLSPARRLSAQDARALLPSGGSWAGAHSPPTEKIHARAFASPFRWRRGTRIGRSADRQTEPPAVGRMPCGR
ncbi:hypothetical protein IWX90DRAFT_433065 [Phyllosticta citrichinensis]|uniref:Uncharacterized protein n=1 Tax=Phyllosticta citrichinensis TaxID=1130410 RepID=A0ABR1XTT3_9PEZI